MTDKEIISNHMRNLAKKSHKAVLAKHGADFYSKIGKMGGKSKKGLVLGGIEGAIEKKDLS